MEGQLAVPFHFAAEFLLLAVFLGACLDSVRRVRTGAGIFGGLQALGFAVLVAAQIIHGGRLLEVSQDGALVMVVLRAAGFLLVAVGSRTVSDASSALGTPSGMMLALMPVVAIGSVIDGGASSQLAIAPAVAAGVAAVRGFAAHKKDEDPASFAFTAAFVAFAVGEALLTITPATGGGALLAASHGLRFVGGLLLMRWLVGAIARSVRLRFVAAFVVALTLLVLVLSAAINSVIASNITTEGLVRTRITANARREVIAGKAPLSSEENFLFNLARSYGNVPAPQAVSALACVFADHSFFESVDAKGVVIGSALHRAGCELGSAKLLPGLPGPIRLAIPGTRVVSEAMKAGNPAASIEILPSSDPKRPTGVVALLAAAPIRSNGVIVGALVSGRFFDRSFLCSQSGGDSELTLLSGGEVIESTIDGVCSTGRSTRFDLAAQLVAKGLGDTVRVKVEEGLDDNLQQIVTVDRKPAFVAYTPLRRVSGEGVAVLAVTSDAGSVAASQDKLNSVLFLLALGAALLASAIASAAGGRFARPIRALTAAAEAIRHGDLKVQAPAGGEDEVGRLGSAFNGMAASLDQSTAELREAVDKETAIRSQMEAIMQSMSDAVVATDAQQTVTSVNLAAEKLTGRKASDLIGQPLAHVLTGAEPQGRSLAEAALHGQSLSATIHRGKDRVPVAITSAPLRTAGGASSGRVVVLRDVTTEVQAERMKSEFLSNVSHELRTPLTPIKGYTEILKRKNFPKEKAEQFLDGILESTERLERIVEILVDFAAMEAGRLKPQTEPVDVKEFVEGLVTRWKGRTKGTFSIKIPASLPAASADRKLLTKSIDELIDNAVKFSPKGPKVEIVASPVMNGSRKKPSAIRISVRDHGMGIAAEKVPHLFQGFEQGDGSETREFGGLGLGLAYVKRVAGVHGGDVDAESVLGKGSTFSLIVPAAVAVRGESAGRGQGKKSASQPVSVSPKERTPRRRPSGTKVEST